MPPSTGSATTSSTRATTTTSTTIAPTTTIAGEQAPWTASLVAITPDSLGAVRVGMTLAEAQAAAGIEFDGHGDGASYPTTLPTGYAHLFVDSFAGSTVGCVGVELANATDRESITTPEGFRVGDTVTNLRAIYGDRLVHVAAPPSGFDPRDGYTVAAPAGYLLTFSVDAKGTVWGISAGKKGFDGKALVPSTCIG